MLGYNAAVLQGQWSHVRNRLGNFAYEFNSLIRLLHLAPTINNKNNGCLLYSQKYQAIQKKDLHRENYKVLEQSAA